MVLGDGSVLSCKDDYNSRRSKAINAPFKFMAQWQKYYHLQIKKLYEKEGSKVTLELINRYGINLSRPFEYAIKERRYVFYYHKYAIEKIDEKFFKIFEHGLF